jgi:hypothetical protein
VPKFGDKRKDGYRFWAITKAGYENWLSPKAWRKSQTLLKKRAKERARKYKVDAKFRAEVQQGHRVWVQAHPINAMLHKAKERAIKHRVPFDLKPEDIHIPKRCPVLGKKLVQNKKNSGMNSPSLDRILPSKGYVKGNVLVVSQQANNIKSNATPEQVLRVGKFYQELLRKRRDL